MEKIELYNTGKRATQFDGELLKSISNRNNQSTRWTEIDIYQTKAGRIIIYTTHRTRWQGESDHYSTIIYNTREELTKGLDSLLNEYHATELLIDALNGAGIDTARTIE